MICRYVQVIVTCSVGANPRAIWQGSVSVRRGSFALGFGYTYRWWLLYRRLKGTGRGIRDVGTSMEHYGGWNLFFQVSRSNGPRVMHLPSGAVTCQPIPKVGMQIYLCGTATTLHTYQGYSG